jgi:hypothetical protein
MAGESGRDPHAPEIERSSIELTFRAVVSIRTLIGHVIDVRAPLAAAGTQ